MRILLIHNRCQLGGIETVVRQLLRGFRAAGHDCEFWVAEGKTYPRVPGLRPMYPRLLSRLDHSRLRPLMNALFPRRRWTERVFLRIARSRFDVVHIHGFDETYAGFDALSRVVKSKPTVFTLHGFWPITGGCGYPVHCRRFHESCGDCPQLGVWPIGMVDRTRDHLLEKQRCLGGLPMTIVSPSRHLMRAIRDSRVGRHWRPVWIPNGVDPAQFGAERKLDPTFRSSLGLSPESPCILLSARGFRDVYKGCGHAIEALRTLGQPRAQLVLTGYDSAEAARQLSGALPIIIDAGYVRERALMAAYCEAADIFLFPSIQENFPCALLEAMSAGCAAVAFPVDGVSELVAHGVTGLLAREVSADALAAALGKALANPDAAAAMGRRARETVTSEFSEERMVREHLALYERILRGE